MESVLIWGRGCKQPMGSVYVWSVVRGDSGCNGSIGDDSICDGL